MYDLSFIFMGCAEEQRTHTYVKHLLKRMTCMTATYHGVGVSNEISERVQETLVLYHLSIDVMKFGHTHSCCLPHVWVLIL